MPHDRLDRIDPIDVDNRRLGAPRSDRGTTGSKSLSRPPHLFRRNITAACAPSLRPSTFSATDAEAWLANSSKTSARKAKLRFGMGPYWQSNGYSSAIGRPLPHYCGRNSSVPSNPRFIGARLAPNGGVSLKRWTPLELTHGGLPWRFWPSPLPKSSMTGWRMGYVLRFEPGWPETRGVSTVSDHRRLPHNLLFHSFGG